MPKCIVREAAALFSRNGLMTLSLLSFQVAKKAMRQTGFVFVRNKAMTKDTASLATILTSNGSSCFCVRRRKTKYCTLDPIF